MPGVDDKYEVGKRCEPAFASCEKLAFCWVTTHHRQVSLGYGWLVRGVFGRRNEVIYNGVDLEHWQPVDATALRRALGFAPSDYVIGLSAVLRPEKNPAQLIDAVARLRAIGLPARALYIGDGPERARVEARARALGVADRFVISGLSTPGADSPRKISAPPITSPSVRFSVFWA